MIDLSSLNLYEVIDVDPRATVAEIKRAYQIALKTYGTNHMATYGLFTEAQREDVLNRVQEAYNVLMDPERRRQYDEQLRQRGDYPQERPTTTTNLEVPESTPPRPPLFESKPQEDPEAQQEAERLIEEVLASAAESGEWSGPILQQIREIRGLSLDDIAQHTKIHRGHLRSIEEDSYDFLPPDTYLKGFIHQISKVLRLDPESITPRLMDHIRRMRGVR
jgi:curved DNA-binding protein CbpA